MKEKHVYIVTNHSKEVIFTSLDKDKAFDYAMSNKLIITAYKLN